MRPFYFLCFLLVITFISCSEIDIKEELNSESLLFNRDSDPDGMITSLYFNFSGFLADQSNSYALSEVTTDEQILPTRGADWDDNGIWRDLHSHNWQVDNGFINNVWEQWTEFQCEASTIVESADALTDEQLGQGLFLRALASFYLLDNFGQLPICNLTTSDDDVLTGGAAVDYIIDDLTVAIDLLSFQSPGANNNRAGDAAGRYLLAKVLLNAHIYRNESPDTSDMNEVVNLINDIEGSGYGLESGFFDIFREDTDNETILYLNSAVGNRIWNTLHYNQTPEIAGGGWNGFATLSEFYDLFEGPANTNWPNHGQEERRGFTATRGVAFENLPGTTESGDFPGFSAGSNIGFGFLFGQQYEIDCTPLLDRPGNPLNFERFFVDQNGNPSLEDNSESTGIRTIKYNPQFGGFTNHLLFFRFSDAHLMRVEAMFRSGDVGDALLEINELRTIRNATPMTALTEQDILDERGRELYIETWRRNDLIRFGQFVGEWELKDPSNVGNTNLNVFPIPSGAIIDNPNLVQNPGY